jgi:hypothetical protein
MKTEPSIAFAVSRRDVPGIEVRVNFGVFAGRQATPAEIDELARWLVDEVDAVTIVAEERREFGRTLETSVHLVRIEVAQKHLPENDLDQLRLEHALVERAEHWARSCIANRRAPGIEP